MGEKARPILVNMPLELRARVDEFKRESGMPYVEIVRRALREYLESRQDVRVHARNVVSEFVSGLQQV